MPRHASLAILSLVLLTSAGVGHARVRERIQTHDNEHAAGITAMARTLVVDAEDRKNYERVLHLNERLTNPLATAGYRELLPAAAEGRPLPLSDAPVSFFPPSRGPETDLIKRLYGKRPIPEGFGLMDEVVACAHKLMRGLPA